VVARCGESVSLPPESRPTVSSINHLFSATSGRSDRLTSRMGSNIGFDRNPGTASPPSSTLKRRQLAEARPEDGSTGNQPLIADCRPLMLGRSSASLRPAVRPASSRPTAQSSPPSAASCGSAASRRATDHRPPLGHEAGLPAIDRRLAFSGLALDRHRAHPIGAQQHNPHATHASVGCSPIQSPLLAFRGRPVQAAAELLKTFGVLSERSAWLLYLKASTLAVGDTLLVSLSFPSTPVEDNIPW